MRISLEDLITYRCGAGIETILDELFDHRAQINDDLAGLYLMNLERVVRYAC